MFYFAASPQISCSFIWCLQCLSAVEKVAKIKRHTRRWAQTFDWSCVSAQLWNKKLNLVCDWLGRLSVSMQFYVFLTLLSCHNRGCTEFYLCQIQRHKPMWFEMTSRWIKMISRQKCQPASIKLSIEFPRLAERGVNMNLIVAFLGLFSLSAHLLGFAELFHYLGRHLKVLQQVIGHSVADPRGALGRPELQQLVASLLVGVVFIVYQSNNKITTNHFTLNL